MTDTEFAAKIRELMTLDGRYISCICTGEQANDILYSDLLNSVVKNGKKWIKLFAYHVPNHQEVTL